MQQIGKLDPTEHDAELFEKHRGQNSLESGV